MRAGLLAAACLLLFPLGAHAQFDIESLTPREDSIEFAFMRHRMDSIRRTEGRKTVGLVLSGGGAKGAAHVGVLKYLEEAGMPVDMIVGTSMGGLMGGLYGLGYSADELDTLLRKTDWSQIFSDHVPDRYIPLKTRQLRQTYMIDMPFGKESESDIRKNGNPLLRSLPSGYITGLNVNSILSAMSVGYQDSIAFHDLPIPFYCVASDLVSMKAKNWSCGDLKEAMRSTMSIPLLFEPVKKDGMILIDGGTRNNFPADLAREMGADIIIGVRLSTPYATYDQINNAADMMSPMLDLLLKEYSARNLDIPDIIINPDIHEFNMLSFSSEDIAEIIDRGYKGAESRSEELLRLKDSVGTDIVRKAPAGKAVNLNKESVRICQVEFRGLDSTDASYISRKIRRFLGPTINAESVDKALCALFGTGALQTVSYSLLGDKEPYRLVFECRQAPRSNFGLGIRADSKDLVNLAFNFGLGANKMSGSKGFLSGVLGQNVTVDLHYLYDTQFLPTVNLRVHFNDVKTDLGEMDGGSHYVRYNCLNESFYLSSFRLKWFDMSSGVRFEQYNFNKWLSDSNGGTLLDIDRHQHTNYMSLFAEGGLNTLDRNIFPTKGGKATIGYEWLFCSPGDPEFTPEQIFTVGMTKVFHLARRLDLIPSYNLRVLDTRTNDFVHKNIVGGILPGRYIPQQIPFYSMPGNMIAKDHLSVMQLTLRWNHPKEKLFLSLSGGCIKSDDNIGDAMNSLPQYWGGSAEIGYQTPLGPVRASIGRNSVTDKFGAFVSYGLDF